MSENPGGERRGRMTENTCKDTDWDKAVKDVQDKLREGQEIDSILKEFAEGVFFLFRPPVKLINFFIQEISGLDNSVLIEKKSGENIIVHKSKLDKCIKKFYNKNIL